MAKKYFSPQAYRAIGWIFNLLIVLGAVALVYVILAPHQIEVEIAKQENKLICQDNMYRLAQAEEKYYLQNGEYTEKKVYLLKFDDEADQLRCPATGILYDVSLATFKITDETLDSLRNESMKKFRLTDQALSILREEKIPANVLEQLEPLKNQWTPSLDSYMIAIEGEIGPDETEEYEALILKYVETEDVLPKLEELKGKEFRTQEKFLNALRDAMGKTEADEYASVILEASRIYHKVNPEYRINEEVLEEMRKRDISARVRKQLETLSGEIYKEKEKFLEAVEKEIGERNLEEYKKDIIGSAQSEPEISYTIICPIPEKGDYPNHGKIINARASWKLGNRVPMAEPQIEPEDEEEEKMLEKRAELHRKLENNLFFRTGNEKKK